MVDNESLICGFEEELDYVEVKEGEVWLLVEVSVMKKHSQRQFICFGMPR